jgi:hypothetical protein
MTPTRMVEIMSIVLGLGTSIVDNFYNKVAQEL